VIRHPRRSRSSTSGVSSPRAIDDATHGQPHYAANRQLLADYRAYADDELARLCEVQRQVAGNPPKYSAAR
jgi:hypothetical protein